MRLRWRYGVRPLLVLAVATAACTLSLVWLLGEAEEEDGRMSWLRPPGARDAARYVRPGRQTALLSPRDSPCAGRPPPQLVFAVPTAVRNRDQRDALRDTWGRNASLLFVMGHSGDRHLPEEVVAEALLNDDVLVEDMVDVYDNLTVKSLMMLKWAADHCSQVSYVVKVDDDILLDVGALSAVLAEAESGGWPLVGRLFRRPPPYRSPGHKWFLPRWLYPGDALPLYLSGSIYAVAGWALRPLLAAALSVPLLPLEDIHVSGLAADAAGLARLHVDHFTAYASPLPLVRPCAPHFSVATIALTPDEIRAMWPSVGQQPTGLCWLLKVLGLGGE